MLNRAITLHQKGQTREAEKLYVAVLAQDPVNIVALQLLATLQIDSKNPSAAIELMDRAIKVAPENPALFFCRGLALHDLAKFNEALADFMRALDLNPAFPEALNYCGNALRELKRLDDALAYYDRALRIRPDYAEAIFNRGVALQEVKRLDGAIACYNRALALKPDYIEALLNRGNALLELKRFGEALANYDHALRLKPDSVEALASRGNALMEMKRYDEALACYDRVMAIKPDFESLLGLRISCKVRICDWRDRAREFSRLAEEISAQKPIVAPFLLLSSPLSAAEQRRYSELYIRENFPFCSTLPQFELRPARDRIRLGYFSADFHNHATSQLMAELFERHDRSKFEVMAFSFGAPIKDAMRARLEKSFDRFVEIGTLSDQDAAVLARSLDIDIAIDLKGFTAGCRPGLLAMRAAPIQINYLGYPGTMGADYIDYLIADSTVIPPEQQRHYVEKVVYLPDSYQVNDSKRQIAEEPVSRSACGLPDAGFVFCCFNNNYKITPEIFDVWMRLLKRTEGSVLWLYEDNAAAVKNLKIEAQARGIDPQRLVFAKRVDLPSHLARHRLADIFLDTLPINAHTTASDALWAGLPVLTCLGETFAGRVAASLLRAAGLPELITRDLDEYESVALDLATNQEKLLKLKQQLAANRLACPLFDAARFTGHIETAYRMMWERHQAGLGPEQIRVPSEVDQTDSVIPS